jgi:hypothetical protein
MTPKRGSAKRKALVCLVLSAAISVAWGSWIATGSSSGLGAFKAVFYPARCLMHHSDAYSPPVLQRLYESEGGQFPPNPADAFLFRRAMLVCVNLPTTLLFVVPLAFLPWQAAAGIWMVQNFAGICIAAFLIWMIARDDALKPATFLVGLILANSELLFGLANLSGLVESLCLVAVCCFLQGRFPRAGVVCLGISLALKPQIGGLVWLYFLLAGGAYRKRALQTLLVVAALVLPAVLWVSHVSPQWPQELRTNLHTLSARGSVNDPGPSSLTFRSADTVISLQSTFSLIRDEPGFYNLASYLICGLLLLAGAIRTLQSPFTKQNAWLALASVASLSMLPVYHRAYDAKLLLLAVPACALLWREGGRVKWIAGLMTTLAIASTSDVPATILLGLMNGMKDLNSVQGRLLIAFVFHPAPLVLLATGSFYLWAYFQRTAHIEAENSECA